MTRKLGKESEILSMNKDQILQASRNEYRRQDLSELEIRVQSGYWASVAGAIALAVVMVLGGFAWGVVFYAPVLIYFSMIAAQWTVRFLRLRHKTDLVTAITCGAVALLALGGFVYRLFGGIR